MARKKTAPTLQELSAAEWNGLFAKSLAGLVGGEYHRAETEMWAAAGRELRALLAVAKAARELQAYVGEDGCACGSDACTDVRDMKRRAARAIARLDRLSEPREGR